MHAYLTLAVCALCSQLATASCPMWKPAVVDAPADKEHTFLSYADTRWQYSSNGAGAGVDETGPWQSSSTVLANGRQQAAGSSTLLMRKVTPSEELRVPTVDSFVKSTDDWWTTDTVKTYWGGDAHDYAIQESTFLGCGLFATRAFAKGDLVARSWVPDPEWKEGEERVAQVHFAPWSSRAVNHCPQRANLEYDTVEEDDVPQEFQRRWATGTTPPSMWLRATQDIAAGEEMFTDYVNDNSKYPTLVLSADPSWPVCSLPARDEHAGAQAAVITPVLNKPVVDQSVLDAPLNEPVLDAPLNEPVLDAPLNEPVLNTPVLTKPVLDAPLNKPVVDEDATPLEEDNRQSKKAPVDLEVSTKPNGELLQPEEHALQDIQERVLVGASHIPGADLEDDLDRSQRNERDLLPLETFDNEKAHDEIVPLDAQGQVSHSVVPDVEHGEPVEHNEPVTHKLFRHPGADESYVPLITCPVMWQVPEDTPMLEDDREPFSIPTVDNFIHGGTFGPGDDPWWTVTTVKQYYLPDQQYEIRQSQVSRCGLFVKTAFKKGDIIERVFVPDLRAKGVPTSRRSNHLTPWAGRAVNHCPARKNVDVFLAEESNVPEARRVLWATGETPASAWITALRDIAEDEELLADYKDAHVRFPHIIGPPVGDWAC